MSHGPRGRSVLLVARPDKELLGSYGRAFTELGATVHYWDVRAALDHSVRLGPIGRRFNHFVPVDPWQSRANRGLILTAAEKKPNLLIVGGTERVSTGALAQISLMVPKPKMVLIWPDTLLNLATHVITSLPLYDLVATYSERSMGLFRQLGARNVCWLPFAADTTLYPKEVVTDEAQRREFECDVGFIGNYRPERERQLLALMRAGLRVKAWGLDDWKRSSPETRRIWQGRGLFGADFVRAARASRLFLNVIDDTNYPAANMRFFEALATRSTCIASSCPEMEPTFPDGIALSYYRDDTELVEKSKALLGDHARCERMADVGYETVIAAHTYQHRVRQICQETSLVDEH